MTTELKAIRYVLVEHRSWHLPPERRDAERSYYMGQALDDGTVRILFPLYSVSLHPDKQQDVGQDWIAHPSKIEAHIRANTKLWNDPEYRAAWDRNHATGKARRRPANEVEAPDTHPVKERPTSQPRANGVRSLADGRLLPPPLPGEVRLQGKPDLGTSKLGDALAAALDNDSRKDMMDTDKEDGHA